MSIGRLIGGFAVGQMTVVVTFYIVRLSPSESVAFYGAFVGLGIVSGYLIVFLLGLGITDDIES